MPRGETVSCASQPGVRLIGNAVNMSIQSAITVSSLMVRGEKFSSTRTLAAYSGGSSIPASSSICSATRKFSRVRSTRPRVPISTARVTRSGRASISSWAMNPPIDIPTTRAGPPATSSISPMVSASICTVEKPPVFSVAPMPRLSKVMQR